jgi:hypothetical protein
VIDKASSRLSQLKSISPNLDFDGSGVCGCDCDGSRSDVGLQYYAVYSSEYSIAGGVRKSQRKRPARKATDKSADAAA